eukprot:4367-Heterococcus_DN1.PRE.1
MEYVVGGPVMEYSAPGRQYVSSATQGVLSATSSATLFWDMLAGLEYLHTNCIAHRDLKPELQPNYSTSISTATATLQRVFVGAVWLQACSASAVIDNTPCCNAQTCCKHSQLLSVVALCAAACAYACFRKQNVLLGCDGRAKIGDFGVAHHFSDEVARTPVETALLTKSVSRAQLTRTEGTWSFWAPEMCSSGRHFNAYAADLWAAGVTLWCFLYGTPPFMEESPTELFNVSIGSMVVPAYQYQQCAVYDAMMQYSGIYARMYGRDFNIVRQML